MSCVLSATALFLSYQRANAITALCTRTTADPWLSCLSSVNRLRGGQYASGERIFNRTTWTMLWGPQNAATREQIFEYMQGDTGVSDGEAGIARV